MKSKMSSKAPKKYNGIKIVSVLCVIILVVTVGVLGPYVAYARHLMFYKQLPEALRWIHAFLFLYGFGSYVLQGLSILFGLIGFREWFKLFRSDDTKNAKGMKLLLVLSCLCCMCGVAMILIYPSISPIQAESFWTTKELMGF